MKQTKIAAYMLSGLLIPLVMLWAMDLFSCLGCQAGSNLIPETGHSDSLRVVDINVWSGLDYIGIATMGEYESAELREKRYQLLLTQLQQLKPDIIGIHEANSLPYYAKRLAANLDYDVYYHVGVGGIRAGVFGLPLNMREGDAILARKSLSMQPIGTRQLSGGYIGNFATFHLDDATQVLGVKILFHDTPVFVFATHWHASILAEETMMEELLQLRNRKRISKSDYQNILDEISEGKSWRMGEAIKTIKFVQDSVGESAFILMGDFNSVAGSAEISSLKAVGMIDTFASVNAGSSNGFTWDPQLNLNIRKYYQSGADVSHPFEYFSQQDGQKRRRIDFIFLGNSIESGLTPVGSRVVLNEVIDGVHTSDHFGIFTELEFGG